MGHIYTERELKNRFPDPEGSHIYLKTFDTLWVHVGPLIVFLYYKSDPTASPDLKISFRISIKLQIIYPQLKTPLLLIR
jgi:hypothetical protein